MTTFHEPIVADESAPWHPTGDGLPTYQQVLAADRVPPRPDSVLHQVTFDQSGCYTVPKRSYYDRDFFEKEKRWVWQKVWQPVCHESQVRAPGDVFVYNVAGLSALITRNTSGQLKAYFNSCPHRGTELRGSDGKVRDFTCPFHGFRWDLDGRFQWMPCEWDLTVDRAAFGLAELQIDTWAGFIFVNPDRTAPGLHTYLGEIVEHFEPWAPQNRVQTLRITQSFEANWKAATEAFLETFHVVTVHRQSLPRTADTSTQYDLYPPHMTRMLSASNVASAHVRDQLDEQRILDAIMAQQFGGLNDGQRSSEAAMPLEVLPLLPDELRDNPTVVPEGWTARAVLGALGRAQVKAALGEAISDELLSDAEVSDSIHYTVFPAFNIVGGYAFGNVFWFRPVADDPQRCEMEFYISRPGRPGEADNAPPMKEIHLQPGDAWLKKIPELGGLGLVFDQDTKMLARQQRGITNSGRPDAILTAYTESRIRGLRGTLDRYLSAKDQT